MAVCVDNSTFISSNCSNNNVIHTTYNFGCFFGYYIHVAIICIIIFPLNIWALWLIRKTTSTQRGCASFDLLYFNLIFASEMFCIASILNCLLIFNTSESFFYISDYILSVSLMAKFQFHTWICVENYLAVVHPILYLKLKQSWYKIVWVTFTWITSNVYGGLLLFMQNEIAVFLYIIPLWGLLLLILFCCVATLARLKKPIPGEGVRGEKMHYQKIKAFKIITMVIMFTYFPYLCLEFFWSKLLPEMICIAKSVIISLLLPGGVFQSLLYISRVFRA